MAHGPGQGKHAQLVEMGQMGARRPPTPPPFGPIDDDKHAPGAGASRRSSAGDVVCPICLADTVDNKNHHFVKFICGHQFHASCYFPWHLKSSICPYCKHAAFLPNPISLLLQKIMPGVNEALFPPIPQLSDQLQPYWLHLNLEPELENIHPVWQILEAIRKLFDREKLKNYIRDNRGILPPALAAQESYKNNFVRWSQELSREMSARRHELQNFLQQIDILLTNHPRIYDQSVEIFRQLFPGQHPPTLAAVRAALNPATISALAIEMGAALANSEEPPPSYADVEMAAIGIGPLAVQPQAEANEPPRLYPEPQRRPSRQCVSRVSSYLRRHPMVTTSSIFLIIFVGLFIAAKNINDTKEPQAVLQSQLFPVWLYGSLGGAIFACLCCCYGIFGRRR